jgi:Zn-dependent protease with chaperone function
MWKAVVVVVCLGLGTWADTPKLSAVSAKALQFFAQIEDASFDAYLKRVRLPKVTAEFKAQVLAQLGKEKGVKVSEKMQAKLAALMPLLQYHERDAVLDIKVIEAPQAVVRTQGRAVLLLSETTLRLLSTEELQAIVAHELSHEYFWGELMQAREQKNYALLREIELRCDGIAVIALQRLGMDAQKLLGAITKLTTFNARVMTTDPLYHPLLSDRMDFIQAMRELVQLRAGKREIAHQ